MDTAELVRQDLLAEATRRLAVEFNPEQVWLFGSHAWGVPDEGSDLDLMVVVGASDEAPTRRARRAHGCPQGLAVAKGGIVKTQAEVERFRNVRSSLHRGGGVRRRAAMAYWRSIPKEGLRRWWRRVRIRTSVADSR